MDDAEESGEVEAAVAGDVALRPGPNADPETDIDRNISAAVRSRYDVFSYRHAASILAHSFPDELADIVAALDQFEMTVADIGMPGGNESIIPKRFAQTLRPKNWVEARIQGDLLVRIEQHSETMLDDGRFKKEKLPDVAPQTIDNFIDGHKIDFVKGRVAFDMEWNSKDQTFDRDLYAFRTFHDCGLISVAVMVTRSASLNPVFDVVPQLDKSGKPVGKPVKAKYGASTTWMGKLLYRLNAGRHGGCPVLVFGMTPRVIADWETPV